MEGLIRDLPRTPPIIKCGLGLTMFHPTPSRMKRDGSIGFLTAPVSLISRVERTQCNDCVFCLQKAYPYLVGTIERFLCCY